MHFVSLIASLGLVLATSALPTLRSRDAGPSGSVIIPTGGAEYSGGGAIHFQYHAVSTDDAQTSSVAVQLVTFCGKVTHLCVSHPQQNFKRRTPI